MQVNSIIDSSKPLSAVANDSKVCLAELLDDVNDEELKETIRSTFVSVLKTQVTPEANITNFIRKIQGGGEIPTASVAENQAAVGSKKKRRIKRKDGKFSEPLPSDVTADEASHRTSKLFSTLTKFNDELGNWFRTPVDLQ